MQAALNRLAARRWAGLLAALALGVLAGLGQAPLGLFPLTLVGLALGLGLVLAASGRWRAAALGWALGTGFFGATWPWIVEPFLVDIARHGWMAPFALFFLSGGMALYWGLAAGLAHRVRPGLRWIALAAGLGLAELLRGWAFTGFSWGGPGLIWIDTPMAQLAAWIGVYGLSFVTFLLSAGLLAGALRPRWLALWGVGLAAFAGLGIAADRRALPERGEPVTLRLVQPNAPQHLKWDPEWVMTFFERAEALTAAPPEGSAPDLVIWPETSIPSLLGQVPALEARAVAAAAPAPLVAGIQRRVGGSYRNALVYYDAPGDPVWVYDKHHLVPFGEFVPFGDLMAKIGVHGLAQTEGFGFSEGPGPVIHRLPGALGQVLPVICYEAIFPRDIRGAEGRADWILQGTNDAWFGTFSGPQQHLVQARFRSIEFGLPLARAANTGISAVIDAKGGVVASLGLGVGGFVDAALPAPLPPTVYARSGDLPLIVLMGLIFAGLIVFAPRKSVDPV